MHDPDVSRVATRDPDLSCARVASRVPDVPSRCHARPWHLPHNLARSRYPLSMQLVPRATDPLYIYQRLGRDAAPTPSRMDPSVYHPVALRQDPKHVHPMVTRRAAGVLQPVARLVLSASTSPHLSPEPSSARGALVDPNWCRAMEYEAL